MSTELTYYNAARNALQQAAAIDEVKDIKDKAEAMRLYAQQQHNDELENYAAKIKARALRRIGQLSAELETAKPGPKDTFQRRDLIPKNEALKEAGVSKASAYRAEKLAEIPQEVFEEKIEQGKTVTEILKEVRTEEIKQEREKIKERAECVDSRWSVRQGDIYTYCASTQFDFIITDPPYLKKDLGLYGILAINSNYWLKPGGMLIAMCGQSYLDEIYAKMSEHLQYYWTACYLTPGQPTPLRHRNVNTTWKPLLCFTKGGYRGKIFGDVFKSDGNDKSLHKWGQSESGMLSIIQGICLPGQSIFDPFMGAGTTGVAALKHGCLFEGIDIDEENVKLTRGRLRDC